MSFRLLIIKHLLILKWEKIRYRGNYKVLQNTLWIKFVKESENSKFYSKLFKDKTLHKEFPLMNKNLFMDNFDTINTQGIKLSEAERIALKAEVEREFSPTINGVTVGLSSGTSGNRGVFLASDIERAQWIAFIIDRVIGFKFKKRQIAFFLRANSNLYESAKSKLISFNFFDLFNDLKNHIDRLNKLNPTILVAQPSMLLQLAEEKERGNLNISPEKIISVAEVLTPEDKNRLTKVFNQTIHQVYQCTEGFLAHTCKNGTLHFNEDFLIIEKKYIDKDKTRFHPVITDLKRSTQPVIRYELNDIIHEEHNCSCELKTTAIKMIEGRSDDILSFFNLNREKIKIFPDFFRRAIIFSDKRITDYYLVQTSLDNISLYVNIDTEAYNNAVNGISKLLKKYEVNNINISQLHSYNVEKGSKLRRIKNETRKTN